jgi:antirestriction protein ArdC
MRMQMVYGFEISLLYHGVNVLILGMDLRALRSGDPRWVTYQQAQDEDSQIRKGEHSTAIFFAKPFEVEDDGRDDGREIIRVLKHHAVLHTSQIDGRSSQQGTRDRGSTMNGPQSFRNHPEE